MTTANSTLLDVAAQNDVHNWTPAMPLHMRYCTEDEEVWFQNAVSAFDWMSASGAPDVEAFNPGDSITMVVRCRPSQQVFCGFCP